MLQRAETRLVRFLTVAEVSERTGIACRTIRNMAQRGEVAGAERIGRVWFLPESELEHIPRRERGWQVKPKQGEPEKGLEQ